MTFKYLHCQQTKSRSCRL